MQRTFIPMTVSGRTDCSASTADTKAVHKTLTEYEKSAILEPIETACVITKDGKVYKCFGSETNVHPEFDLGENLRGAIVSHNHPIEKTEYTLSREDITLFKQYDIQVFARMR